MPQLDTATFAPQLVWLAFTFVILYLLMARVALPRIAEVLEERHERITDDLELAEKLRDEAEAAIQAYEAALGQARSEAHALATETRDAALAEAQKRSEAHEERLRARLREAEARIAEAKREAVRGLGDVTAGIARDAIAKLIGIEVDEASARRAVEGRLGGND